jgi:hypothetical protein
MKKLVIAGTLATAVAVGATAYAQTPAPKTPPPAPAGAAAQKPATPAETPAKPPKPKRTRAAATGENSAAGHTAPKAQPTTTDNPNAQDQALVLGTVHIPKAVKADGKDLAAGTYQVRLTADEAKPDAKGSSEVLERWVEFLKGGKVVGREVVSIVPNTETKLVQKDAPPPANGHKIETLKGGDYVRVWFNKGGNYYLIHLVNA